MCLSLLVDSLATSKQDAQATKKKGTGRDKSAHDVLEYACLNWVTHVQRLEEKGVLDNRLTALLEQFLGSMHQSSLEYQKWHEMMGRYIDGYSSRNPRPQRYRGLPLHKSIHGSRHALGLPWQ